MAVGVFAGIPVRDYTSAVEWYKRLLGSEPTFYPNDVEAVWQLAEDRYVYIIEAPERAGGAVGMIWVDNPVSEIAKISDRGLEWVKRVNMPDVRQITSPRTRQRRTHERFCRCWSVVSVV